MKKQILSLVTAVCMLISFIPVIGFAENTIEASGICGIKGGDNMLWSLDTSGTLTISGTGKMGEYNAYNTHAPWYDYRESIKTVIAEGSITNIGRNAFKNCPNLTSVTIQDGITAIDSAAFWNSASLESINIPDSVTDISSDAFLGTAYYDNPSNWEDNVLYIDNHLIKAKTEISGSYAIKPGTLVIASRAFADCADLTGIDIPDSVTNICWYAFGQSGLTSVTIPESVKDLAGYAFYNCQSLKNATLRRGLENINNFAFYLCTALESINIPDSVQSIGYCAFCDCCALTGITLPNSLTDLDGWAFEGCSSLTDIEIPDSVTEIKENTFDDCDSLVSIHIPDSVTSIERNAFPDNGMLNITVDDNNPVYSELDGVLFNKDKTTLVAYTKDKIQPAYRIPDSVTQIAPWAFRLCGQLTKVKLPDSITDIGTGAFFYCDSLTSFTIPDGVTVLLESTFSRCSSLAEIIIPKSVVLVEVDAFNACSSLADVYYTGTEEEWKQAEIRDGRFDTLLDAQIHYNYNSDAVTSGICGRNGGDNVRWSFDDGTLTLSGEGEMEDYEIWGIMPWNDFYNRIKTVIVEDGITNIGQYAFSLSYNLTSVSVGADVRIISESSFADCEMLERITLPISVTYIGKSVFHQCDSLKEICYDGNSTDWSAINGCQNVPSNMTILYLDEPVITETDGDFNVNIYTKSSDCQVYAAAYNSDGILLSVNTAPLDNEGKASVRIETPEYDYVKIFIWTDKMKPVSAVWDSRKNSY